MIHTTILRLDFTVTTTGAFFSSELMSDSMSETRGGSTVGVQGSGGGGVRAPHLVMSSTHPPREVQHHPKKSA